MISASDSDNGEGARLRRPISVSEELVKLRAYINKTNAGSIRDDLEECYQLISSMVLHRDSSDYKETLLQQLLTINALLDDPNAANIEKLSIYGNELQAHSLECCRKVGMCMMIISAMGAIAGAITAAEDLKPGLSVLIPSVLFFAAGCAIRFSPKSCIGQERKDLYRLAEIEIDIANKHKALFDEVSRFVRR